jgi:hypothetical protein
MFSSDFMAREIHFFFLSFLQPAQPMEILVPQDPYRARGRDFVPSHPPIQFNNGSNWGMSLRDALDGKYQGLQGRDDPMFKGFGSSISLRIQVRGFTTTLHVVLIVAIIFMFQD